MTSALSRRRFLKWAGAAGAGAAVSTPNFNTTIASTATVQTLTEDCGRAFKRTAVFAAPDFNAPIVDYVLPEVATPILGADTEWYRLSSGYVPRTALQPIAPYQLPEIDATSDFAAEVIATSTLIRDYCSVLAPIVTRLGWGAVMQVTDRLFDDERRLWYGFQLGSRLVWSPALHWSKITLETPIHADRLLLARNTGVIEVFYADQSVARLPIRLTDDIQQRDYVVESMAVCSDVPKLGTAYALTLTGGMRIYGVYWHNAFGSAAAPFSTSEAAQRPAGLEMPSYAAKALYKLMTPGVTLEVK